MEEELVFPPELNVNIMAKCIELDLPKNPPKEVMDFLLQSQGSDRNVVLKPKPRTSRTKIIQGGTPEKRMDYLLNLLDKMELFSKPQNLMYPRYILSLLDDRVTPTTTKEELEAFQKDINLDKFDGYVPPQSVSKEAVWGKDITVGPAVSSLLVYYLASKEDTEQYEKFLENLDFCIISLSVPLRCFVRITKEEKGLKYSFTDMSESITADVVNSQIASIIKTISKIPLFKVKFHDCDPAKMKDLFQIQKEVKFQGYVMSHIIEDEESDLVTSDVYIFTRGGEEAAKAFAEAAFIHFKVSMCSKCHCVFGVKDTVCYKFYHAGERIPFGPEDNYEMEVEEFDEDDNPYTMYNYTCCGEVPADEPGCMKKENGEHVVDTTHKQISKLEFLGSAIFLKNL